MKTVYVLVGAFSGEDYNVDDPEIFGVYSTYEKAKKALQEVIKDYEPSEDESADVEDSYEAEWECTNYDADSHVVIRIVAKEIE